MLEVVVRLLPYGSLADAKVIGRIYVANISGRPVSDYEVWTAWPGDEPPAAYVRRHQRSRGAWRLVRRAIQALEKAEASDV